MTMPTKAIVRAPGQTYPEALTRQDPRPPVDLDRARTQHAEYVAALRRTGLTVSELPPDGFHSDAVFVQDRVCVLDGRGIVGRSAVASRDGEEGPILEVLRRSIPIAAMRPPAFLDWGDVLIAEDRLFVGLSERSNEASAEQLQEMLAPRWKVTAVPTPADLLHLLSGCSYLGGGLLLAVDSLHSFAKENGMEVLAVPPEEAGAANTLALGPDVIVPAGYPETETRIARTGRRVHPVPVSEFEKRDGGVTCLSILY